MTWHVNKKEQNFAPQREIVLQQKFSPPVVGGDRVAKAWSLLAKLIIASALICLDNEIIKLYLLHRIDQASCLQVKLSL